MNFWPETFQIDDDDPIDSIIQGFLVKEIMQLFLYVWWKLQKEPTQNVCPLLKALKGCHLRHHMVYIYSLNFE